MVLAMGTFPRSPEFEDQLRRVRQEYLDTPNLQLSPSGLQRLFGLRPVQCVEILEAMLGEDFLRRLRASGALNACRLAPAVWLRGRSLGWAAFPPVAACLRV